MKVFVAGGTGVIGRRLVPLLVDSGHQVTVMTRRPGREELVRAMGAEAAVADVFDRPELEEVIARAEPDVLIHQLTSLPRAISPRKIADQFADNDRVRVEGTRNLVAAAVTAGVGKIVAQSIAFVYEPRGGMIKDETDPLWLTAPEPFARSVRAVESLEDCVTMTDGIEGVVLRYGYLYGPETSYARDGQIAEMVRKRHFPVVGDGGAFTSFVHVEDAAQAALAALGIVEPGIYNIVDDEPAPLSEWLPVYATALQTPPARRVPRLVASAVAGRYGLYLMTEQRGASNAKAKRSLRWKPAYASWRAGFTAALR